MDIQTAWRQTLDYLYEQLPMFSKLGKDAIKKDLTNIRKLCTALNEPHTQFRSIHIAGTNGKGSTSHMLAAVMQQAGYKTGLYTSPHLVDFRERIRINGEPVSREWVIDFVNSHQALIEEIQPSFFEITVAMAFTFFVQQQVDVAIIETGLGGRLDSTNIITPELSVITNISYDHMDMLGHTLQEIAAEKAGIIKPGVPVLIGEQQEETERVFSAHALQNKSKLYYASSFYELARVQRDTHFQYFRAVHIADQQVSDLKTDLLGSYQYHNIKTVLAAAEILHRQEKFVLLQEQVFAALAQVKALSGLRGRWEWLQQRPLIIADVGHNPAGIKEVMEQWREIPARKKYILTGFVRDKDISEALKMYPSDSLFYFCNAQIPRALPAAELAEKAHAAGLSGDAYDTIAAGVKAALSHMDADDALLVTGSFFVVGEALEALGMG